MVSFRMGELRFRQSNMTCERANLTISKRRIRHRPNLQTPQLTDIQPRKSADNEVLDSNSDYARSNDRTAVSGKATSQVDLKPTAEPQSLKQSEKKATSKHLVVKREQSDIFKSFSKPKSRLNREDTNSSVEAASTVATEISVRSHPLPPKRRNSRFSSMRKLAFGIRVNKSYSDHNKQY